jgi:dihydroflavonol-4-reductase
VRALVTGATGFVGASVVRELLKDGHSVRVLARKTSNRANLKDLADRVEVAEGDLRDRASLRRALERCDALFHVAASYSLWARDPAELYESNVWGTRAIMEEALALRIDKVVYTSSVAVLAPPKPGAPPADESAEPVFDQIIGHYKRSKYLADQAVRELCGRGLRAVIVLPSTPIGPRDVKPTPTGKIVLDFLRGKMPGYVETGLNIVDVEDCARGHILALERGKPGERYILGNENLSLKAILDTLAELTGLPGPKFRVPYAVAYAAGACSTALAWFTGREPGIPLDGVRMSKKLMYFDPAKARRELGFPATPAREALRKAALWFCREGYVPAEVSAAVTPRLEKASPPASATAEWEGARRDTLMSP